MHCNDVWSGLVRSFPAERAELDNLSLDAVNASASAAAEIGRDGTTSQANRRAVGSGSKGSAAFTPEDIARRQQARQVSQNSPAVRALAAARQALPITAMRCTLKFEEPSASLPSLAIQHIMHCHRAPHSEISSDSWHHRTLALSHDRAAFCCQNPNTSLHIIFCASLYTFLFQLAKI